MEYKKKFIHFLSINGSGNHLIVDILKNYEISRVSDNLDRLVALLTLKRNNYFEAAIDWPEVYLPSDEHIVNLDEYLKNLFKHNNINIDNSNCSDEQIIVNFINHFNKETNLYLTHSPGYLIFEQKIRSRNETIFFNSKMIEQANKLLDNSLSIIGYQREKIALIRNPIDIYLSLKERLKYFDDKLATQTINTFFSQIKKNESLPIIKYEKINKIHELLFNYKIIQKNENEKILYQPQKYKYLGYLNFDLEKYRKIFILSLDSFQYSNLPQPTFLKYLFFRTNKVFDELKLLYFMYFKKYNYKGKLNHSKISKLSRLAIKILDLFKN